MRKGSVKRQIFGAHIPDRSNPSHPPVPSIVHSEVRASSSRLGDIPSTVRLVAPMLIALTGGSTHTLGSVEVGVNGKFFAVCETGIDNNVARVIIGVAVTGIVIIVYYCLFVFIIIITSMYRWCVTCMVSRRAIPRLFQVICIQ